MMFSNGDLATLKEMLADNYKYHEIAEHFEWRLSNGKPNVSRVWRAVQRIRRDTAGAKGVKSFSTKDVVTVGDAVALAISVLKSIPRSAYMIPIGFVDQSEKEPEN